MIPFQPTSRALGSGSATARRFDRVVPALVLVFLGLASGPPARAGELADLLRASLDHPGVTASQRETAAAEQELRAARGRYFGAGGLSAQTARFEDPRFVGVLSPAALADPPFSRDLTTYAAFYRIPIDLAGAIKAGREAAAHDLAGLQLAERQTGLLKLHDVTSAYVRLQALKREAEVLAVQRRRVEQTVERVEQQVATEEVSIAELRLAEAELARLEADEERLAGAVAVALAALEEASGRQLEPASAEIHIPDWPTAEPEGLLPARVAEARARSAEQRAEEARRSLWPRVSVGADYQTFDGGPDAPDAWSISAGVTVPIDPALWRRSAAASARADAAVHAREAARREARRNWTQLQAGYRSARADAAALDKEIQAREEVVRVQAELQRVGMASLEDFLRQQRDLLDAESRRASARASAVTSWSAAQILLGVERRDYVSQVDVR